MCTVAKLSSGAASPNEAGSRCASGPLPGLRSLLAVCRRSHLHRYQARIARFGCTEHRTRTLRRQYMPRCTHHSRSRFPCRIANRKRTACRSFRAGRSEIRSPPRLEEGRSGASTRSHHSPDSSNGTAHRRTPRASELQSELSPSMCLPLLQHSGCVGGIGAPCARSHTADRLTPGETWRSTDRYLAMVVSSVAKIAKLSMCDNMVTT